MKLPIVVCLLLTVCHLMASLAIAENNAAVPSEAAAHEFFEKQVRPILVEQCYKCHSATAKRLEAGLRLDNRSGLLAGGDTGPAIVPGKPDDSLLVKGVRYDDVALQMPPHGKLPADQIAALTTWVKMGAPWPGDTGSTPPVSAKPAFDLEGRKRAHWAWQSVQVKPVPSVQNQAWPLSDVDRYVLAKLEAAGIKPASGADRRTLLRRLHFDLTGLPPTPAEVIEFEADRSLDAYERLVDRLLASPAFGEHWARHWLDLARYAESRGHEYDYTTPNAWQYRDYVIRAFNADLPYDQFVREQVAGDLLPKPRLHPSQGFNESILGTGFWFLGEWVHSPVDIRKDETERLDNQVDTFSKTFLGLTVACARCHDHKFDAISTKDYYALFGFLRSSRYRLAAFDTEGPNRKVAEQIAQTADRQGPVVREALAAAIEPQIERTADYLLAARESLRMARPADIDSKEKQSGGDRLREAFRSRVAAIANVHGVDADRLADWVEYLLAAQKNPADPLHLWAVLARDRRTDATEHWSKVIEQSLGHWRAKSEAAAAAMKSVRVIVDYANCSPADWIQDGFAFGTRPLRLGDVMVAGTEKQPTVEIAAYASADKDPLWDGLKLAAGVQNEPTRMSGWVRAGRTLHTKTFQLDKGKLYYLLKGSCRVYAEVDGHRTNNGPLHGKLITKFEAGDKFRWVRHDLSAYRGRFAHVEFTPEGKSEFAVAMVVEADEPPPLPAEESNAQLVELLERDGATPAGMARGLQKLFHGLVRDWAGDQLSTDAADAARLVDWLAHNDLFAPSGDAGQTWQATARKWLIERQQLQASIKPEMHLAMAMLDATPLDENVLIRGNTTSPGEVVPRRFLEAIAGANQPPITVGSGRLELAERMLDPANPFITRVLVNRLWKHLFGRGIVPSVDNFGVLGEKPTHPELLDYLADRLPREGWSLKRMIKLMVMTRSYQMASKPADAQAESLDPKNLLLHRMPLRRLEAESIRDSILAVSGTLRREMGGPSVPVFLTTFLEGRGRPESGPLDGAGRRSIYVGLRRNFLPAMMLAFDMPIPFATVGLRSVSNVPAQSLILMNDPFVAAEARAWSERLLKEASTGDARVGMMYMEALGRQPTADERDEALRFVAVQEEQYRKQESPAAAAALAWADLCHVVFNLKEFVFIE
jgi:cytochrome c553